MITWLWRTANEAQRTLHDIAIRLVWLDIASIITTSTVSCRVKCSWLRFNLLFKVLTHILYDLATYTSYIEPLREEISMIVEAEGWNKVSMEKMRKLDSFMKESHRLNGSGFGKNYCTNLIQIYSSPYFLLSHDSTIGNEWLFFLWWPFHSKGDEFCCRWSWNQSRWGKFHPKFFRTLDGTQGSSSGITTTRKNSKGSVLLIRILWNGKWHQSTQNLCCSG